MGRVAKPLAALLCGVALAAAGCGGDEGASSPLGAALGYMPEDVPLAVVADTGAVEGAGAAASALPGGGDALDQLREQLGGTGLSFDDDIRPLLGNPVAIGAVDAASVFEGGGSDRFVAALQADDADGLGEVVESSGAKSDGEVAGATVYSGKDGDAFAVDGDVLVVAGSRDLLEAALEREDAGEGLDQDDFDDALADLPGDAPVRVYGDAEAILEGMPGGADALRQPWIGALETLGLTLSWRGSKAANVDFRLATDPEGLTDEQLPIAPGPKPPRLVLRDGRLSVGVRDPAQLGVFVKDLLPVADPDTFGDLATAERLLGRLFDISLDDDVIGQLDDELWATVGTDGEFAMRSDLRDSATFAETLDDLANILPQAATTFGISGAELNRLGGGLYELDAPDVAAVVFGVVDGSLVVASSRAEARRMARAQPTDAPGAKGSVAFSGDLAAVIGSLTGGFDLGKAAPSPEDLGLGDLLDQLGGKDLRGLGDRLEGELTGSVEASTEALTGRVELSGG